MSAKETPRAAALRLLEAVLGEGRMLSEETLDGLSPGDRARAQRLAVDTLRHLDKADYVLEPYLKKAPPLRAMNVLRLATVELCSGGEAHGVVNDAVNLVGASKRGQVLKGMVNAVLRRVAGEGQERWDTAPGARLPAWLRQPLLASWGTPAVRAMEARFEEVPSLDLTAKGDAAALAQALAGDLLPTGTVRLAAGAQVSALAGFAEGAFWVQDAAAALPARLLAAQPGERVLDLCAAPGGKTMQLAAAGADVLQLEKFPPETVARCRAQVDALMAGHPPLLAAAGDVRPSGSPFLRIETSDESLRHLASGAPAAAAAPAAAKPVAALVWTPKALKLAEFKPAFGLNPQVLARYNANRLRVVRNVNSGTAGAAAAPNLASASQAP